MKKSIGLVSLVVVCFLVLFYGQTVLAANETQHESDLSIFFEKGNEPDKPKPPVDPIDPGAKPKPGPLPQTGELLTSFIFLLLGVALMILVIGIVTIKKICEMDYELDYKEAI